MVRWTISGSARRPALRTELRGIGPGPLEVRLKHGDPSGQRSRHRDPVLHQDAVLDHGFRRVFLHERLALLSGKPEPEIAARREIREHLAVRRRVRNRRALPLDARLRREESLVEGELRSRDRACRLLHAHRLT